MKTNGGGGGKERFPIVIRRGSATVRIFKERAPTTRSGVRFLVAWHVAGKRHRKSFQDIRRAKAEASAAANQLASGDAAGLELSSHDRASYVRAVEALKQTGVSVDDAAKEYAAAFAELAGTPLLEVVRYYSKRHPDKLPTKTVAELVEEFAESKRAQGMSERYIGDIQSRLGRFAGDFKCAVAAVTGREVADWLDGLKLSKRSWNNYGATIRTAFNFGRARGYLPRDWDELDSLEPRKIARGEIAVFTADEIQRLLNAAEEDFKPCLAIGAFAGLRAQEIERLDWSDVNLVERFVKVSAAKAKTGSRRLAPMPDNLAAWLQLYAGKAGPVWPPDKSFFKAQRRAARKAGVEWKANAPRHTCISCRVTLLKDVPRVALESGNSPQMIFQHYLSLVTEAEAKRWFAVSPTAAENVVQLESAKA